MITEIAKAPTFSRHQQVSFIGGEGIIRSFKYENGTWKYLVEMPLAIPIPIFGRVGAETIVLLDEVELDLIGN
jgi:hypothetical protein